MKFFREIVEVELIFINENLRKFQTVGIPSILPGDITGIAEFSKLKQKLR